MLKTLDFSATHVNVFVIELDGTNADKDNEVIQLLKAHNYVLEGGEKSTGNGWRSNGWFVHKSYQPASMRAGRLHSAPVA